MSGRITAIDAIHDNPNIIFAGSASGGLWKSTSGGITWEPIFDHEKVHSIGAISIYQKNPNVIWLGTGEGNPRNSLNMNKTRYFAKGISVGQFYHINVDNEIHYNVYGGMPDNGSGKLGKLFLLN